MVPEIVTGLSILNSSLDMAKGLKNINDATVRNAAIIELQEKILAAYSAHAALIERVGELEEKVASFEKWEAEKSRYQLTDYGGSTFAYELKKAMSNGEPPHRICASCYQHGRKSILQSSGQSRGQELYFCPECKQQRAFGVKHNAPLSASYLVKSDWMKR